ncbi:MAG: O-antigen ligase family protein [Hyphomonadaceae bacterium]
MAVPMLMGLTGAMALVSGAQWRALKRLPPWLILFAAFTFWAALSSLWSPTHGPTALKVMALAAFGAAFAAAAGKDALAARLSLSGATAALVVLSALLSIEAIFGMPFSHAIEPRAEPLTLIGRPARGLVVLLALVWPAAAWFLSERRLGHAIAAAACIIAVGLLSTQFGQTSTLAGFSAGLTAFALALAIPRLTILAVTWGVAAWLLAAPFLTPLLAAHAQMLDAVPFSWEARVGIWRYVCARIVEQPWIGHGLDAGRSVADTIVVRGIEMQGTPLHPHSASLQIWFDTGAVGAGLAAALIALSGWRLAHAFERQKYDAAAIAATFAMFGLMANVGWSIWQEWWASTLIVAAALLSALAAARGRMPGADN